MRDDYIGEPLNNIICEIVSESFDLRAGYKKEKNLLQEIITLLMNIF